MRSQSTEWWSELQTIVKNPAFLAQGGDFALLTIPQSVNLLNNYWYGKEGTGLGPLRQTVGPLVGYGDSFSGIVQILASAADPVEGHLLPGETYIRFGKDNVQTRKIELSAPLSTGTSGAWVVRGDRLYGVIIAVYEREPYAHMITSERLYKDIEGSLPGFDAANRSASINRFKRVQIATTQGRLTLGGEFGPSSFKFPSRNADKISAATSPLIHRHRALHEAARRRGDNDREKRSRMDSASRFGLQAPPRSFACPFYKRYPNSMDLDKSCKRGRAFMYQILEHIYVYHSRWCSICTVSIDDGSWVCKHL
ncbi:hypothetical protein B0J18DRAFT_292092 [Chaetomium sp. MPI-SDFR-AT-0129]|nr:hypothetical protein B0J18DRAFT_292092 [Chaetomium sp. MPI-SDFR-AT-0129]